MNCRSCGNVLVGKMGLCLSCLRDVFLFEITPLIREIQISEQKGKGKGCFRSVSCGKTGADCKWSKLCHLNIGFSFDEFQNAIRDLQFFEKNPDCMGTDRSRTCQESSCLFWVVCLPDFRQGELQKAV